MKALIFDFSRTLLFPKDENYKQELNALYKENKDNPGFKFWGYFRINEELLEYLRTIKDKYLLYIFTSGSVQNAPEVIEITQKLFREVYSAKELNADKKDTETYKLLSTKIGVNTEDCLFIDDSEANILAAGYAGMKTIHYKNFEDFKMQFEKLIA